MMTHPLVRGCKAATFNANGLKTKVQVGNSKRNRACIMLTVMRTHDIGILGVQEPHFSSAEELAAFDELLKERDCHPVGGSITPDRGGVCLLLTEQWRVMRYEQLQPRILIAEVMDKLDQKLVILAAHFSEQVEERQRLLLQRSSSLTGHLLTLCDHNSLLFPTSEPLQPAVDDTQAVLAGVGLEF